MDPRLHLRDVVDTDLPIFFEHQLDVIANHMAAFTAKDSSHRGAFMARWRRMLETPTVSSQTIVIGDGSVAGYVLSYEEEGRTEVTYWLGRCYWGSGSATEALAEFLKHGCRARPVYARAAKDNIASLQVLEKCGFTRIGDGRGFANARGEEVDEWLLVLDAVGCEPGGWGSASRGSCYAPSA